jgi:hypothetical protein
VIILINEAKDSPKRKKNFRTQVNGNCNYISSADENIYITVEPLFKNCKRQYIYLSMEDSEVELF